MKIAKMIKSFSYAGKGLFSLIKSENNFQFHLLAASLVILAGFYYNIERWEWAAVLLQIALIFLAEAFNTSIEKIADFIHPDFNEKIGTIKDIAAAGVLAAALIAIAVAWIVFGERIFNLI